MVWYRTIPTYVPLSRGGRAGARRFFSYEFMKVSTIQRVLYHTTLSYECLYIYGMVDSTYHSPNTHAPRTPSSYRLQAQSTESCAHDFRLKTINHMKTITNTVTIVYSLAALQRVSAFVSPAGQVRHVRSSATKVLASNPNPIDGKYNITTAANCKRCELDSTL